MGIVDEQLAQFELDSLGRCCLEADVNGMIHVHLGSVRLELSEREFLALVELVETAHDRLVDIKDLDAAERRPPGREHQADAL